MVLHGSIFAKLGALERFQQLEIFQPEYETENENTRHIIARVCLARPIHWDTLAANMVTLVILVHTVDHNRVDTRLPPECIPRYCRPYPTWYPGTLRLHTRVL